MQLAKKNGLGFIRDWLFADGKKEMIDQLEAVYKAMIFITVSYSLDYIGQDDLLEADQLESVFN